ncbi:uncharacterized protein B0H18DRAFT_972805 [Fomitopsis serialis]|uniref:uncharacterized protein n=1 Tax=Fomitopsis serialis TaxID=139415 RepID=UPI002007A9BE|nr:uncharacterized protein B0H18DRAFT_972805 [Neoantrodia serialis]KAH9936199.1 hypothetical protein B0H18DRAFT_972805 [Neoantrodia serialis]
MAASQVPMVGLPDSESRPPHQPLASDTYTSQHIECVCGRARSGETSTLTSDSEWGLMRALTSITLRLRVRARPLEADISFKSGSLLCRRHTSTRRTGAPIQTASRGPGAPR